MPIVHEKCPTCGKNAMILTTQKIHNLTTTQYDCGHFGFKATQKGSDFTDFISDDGMKPYKYQIEGAEWALANNARVAIWDEMGLGKTTQACMIAKGLWEYYNKPKAKDWSVLVLCKKTLKFQWMKELARWNGDRWTAQILEGEHDFLLPGVRVRILSMDMPWRFKDIEAFKQRLNVKMVILDEAQHIKNTDSKRTNGIRKLCAGIDHVIALSGTPIKNNASEFFPVGNLLAPGLFPTLSNFNQVWVDSYFNGYTTKYGGIKNYNRFKDYTKNLFIRRTREEVMPDLPTISRNNLFSELGSVVEEAYKDCLKDFQKHYNTGDRTNGAAFMSNSMAYLAKMRHLTGIAKIVPCVEFVEDFLSETDRKITIFVHHKDVAEALAEKLMQLHQKPNILSLHSGLSGEARYQMIEDFKKKENRILIASTLASGEGLNIQFCSDCIMLERQWNPANEEQAEGRFIRIGQVADKVSATYMTAIGTVDEFLGKLVEKKRTLMLISLDGIESQWDQSSLMTELMEILAQNGGQLWGF